MITSLRARMPLIDLNTDGRGVFRGDLTKGALPIPLPPPPPLPESERKEAERADRSKTLGEMGKERRKLAKH